MSKDEPILPDVSNIKNQETYTLPSKGLVYTQQDNIPASITLRRMTTAEDKIRMRNQSDDKIKRDILQACILTPGVDAGKLKLMDANFLLFRLRSISLLNDKYKVRCMCPKCRAEFIHELNLLEVPIDFMTEESLNDFNVLLPIGKYEIKLKYPSMDDIINFGERMAEYVKMYPDMDPNELLYTHSMIVYIDTIGGEVRMTEQVEDWLNHLDLIDSRALKTAIDKLYSLYGFSNDIKTTCPNCSNVVTHGLPITRELLTPSN